ncbi:oocyte zinc finger protein XlCOF22-like [Ranitomeya imitator]|uniref:oocyte zinc finger protein XlCOF22-like n=1 Tax=Ranitomeya imitator TaxID=111125 RepID=UPI0037E7BF3A
MSTTLNIHAPNSTMVKTKELSKDTAFQPWQEREPTVTPSLLSNPEGEVGAVTIAESLSKTQKQQCRELLQKNRDLFSELPGHTKVIEHEVLTEPHVRVNVKPYRIPEARREVISKEVKRMLTLGVIEESKSDGCSRSSEKHLSFSHFKAEDHGVTGDSYEEQILIPDQPPNLHIKKLSADPLQQVLSSDSSQTVEHIKNNNTDMQHQITPTREKSFSCSECWKSFISNSHLVIHQRSHSGEKPFSCSECGKCFTQKGNLAIHKRIHTRERSYSCTECKKCFLCKSHLVTHQKIHTKEKPYLCSECGKCFTQKETLVCHQRTHTGEKPFSCPECGKCFRYKSYLVIHQRIHTDEKPFSCLACGKCFRNKSDVVRHQRTHARDKPFSCPECGECFNDSSTLSSHKRTHTE